MAERAITLSLGTHKAEGRRKALQALADKHSGGNISAMIQQIADGQLEVKMSKHTKVTKRLAEAGAAWATRSDKFVDPNDPLEAQIAGQTYHVHPNVSYPHQSDIMRFGSLKEIEEWLDSLR